MSTASWARLGRRLALARELADAFATGRQLSFLDHENGESILDLETELATLA
jgi:hypothetical protein